MRAHRGITIVFRALVLALLAIGAIILIRSITISWLRRLEYTWLGLDAAWCATAIGILVTGVLALIFEHRLVRWLSAPVRRRICPECGYSLNGLRHHRCPECGESIQTKTNESKMAE